MKRLFITFIVLFSLLLIPSCDISQYKRIGSTCFYLCENPYRDRTKLYLHDDTMNDCFLGIEHEGYVNDVLWNNDFIVIKCFVKEEGNVVFWYIMNNIERCDKIRHLSKRKFVSVSAYQEALKQFGISESKMNHTNGTIPWALFHFD